jgi:hypothetical protein
MRRLVPLLASLLLAATGLCEEHEGGSAATNIRAYQILASRIGDSLNAAIPETDSMRVLVAVKPDATSWLVLGGVAEALHKRGRTVVVALPAAFEADLGILEMQVAYGNARTEGMFSGKIVDRDVMLSMSARLIDQRSGVVMLTREFRETMRDTIQVSQIPMLEDPNVPVTQGTLPAEGFFSSLVEPLVMIGAVAVAVYLLFTVRS